MVGGWRVAALLGSLVGVLGYNLDPHHPLLLHHGGAGGFGHSVQLREEGAYVGAPLWQRGGEKRGGVLHCKLVLGEDRVEACSEVEVEGEVGEEEGEAVRVVRDGQMLGLQLGLL